MTHSEKIFLVCAALILGAIIIFKWEPQLVQIADFAPINSPPQNKAWNKWNYLSYNQPYMFAPPVANILPQQAKGILGLPYVQDTNQYSDCGCDIG